MAMHQVLLTINQRLTRAQVDRVLTTLDDVGVGMPASRSWAQVAVHRTAPSLLDAILSAVRDLELLGLAVSGALEHDLVTPADMADRIERSPDAIGRWCTDKVGAAGFPAPVTADDHDRYYSWSAIRPYLARSMGLKIPNDRPVLAAADLALRLRAMAPQVSRMAAIRSLIPA
jgi:hypothetical protein